jgi:DNA (cytosine-5)-methyltransferase 1
MKTSTRIKAQNINQENLDLFNNLAYLQNIKKNLSTHKKPKTFFDFCAGIGSAHLAFKRLGLSCAGYSEIDEKAEKLYNLFHGSHYKNQGDLMKINPEALEDFDILIAGFPCQTFSIAGKRTGFGDERGQVIFGLKKIINHKKPQAFLLENVKGLVNINNGNTLKEILSLLRECNYKVHFKVLESVDFGIPQARERVYLVGIRNDLYDEEFFFPQPIEKTIEIKSFLIDEDENFELKNSAYQTFLKYLKNKYNDGKFKIDELLKQEYLVLDTRQSDLRLYHNKIPTLRTGRQGIFYIKNSKIRKLSAREALLLQGFDKEMAKIAQENFPQSRILAQAGNAMTVDVMQNIGKRIIDYLS